jgi:hypothetical protein
MSGERRHMEEDLSDLHDLALVVEDRATAERLLRIIRALASLAEQHTVDQRGHCALCRPPRHLPWRWRWRWRRHACTVQETLTDCRIGRSALSRAAKG